MTVVCSRAKVGAGRVLRTVACGAFAVFGLFAGGCGNQRFTYGTAVITTSVTPGPFTTYLVDIEGITLTGTNGAISNLFGTNNPQVLERVDLTKLNDVTELFGAPAVLTGTYTSATITVDYTTAQIARDVNGQSQDFTVIDPGTGIAAGVITYTFTFDPAHPLVMTSGASSRVDLNFDLSASGLIDPATPANLLVRPYISISTQPTTNKPLRSRGVFVHADSGAGNFTMNARPFFDDASNPFGAVTVQGTDQTLYYVNGTTYTGAAGVAAISKLSINDTVAAYGTIGSTSGTTPVFNATEVIAGISQENLAADRIIGTVGSLTPTNLAILGGLLITRPGVTQVDVATSQIIKYYANINVPISSTTAVVVDGLPQTVANTQSISIGQQVDLQGQAIYATGTNTVTSVDASGSLGGVVRLTPTTAWGTLLSGAQPGSASLDLVTLGGFEPSAFTFTGTGSFTGADANPTSYVLNTGTLDESAVPAGTLVKATGLVTPFGSAPPDFTASNIALGSATEQVLEIDWAGGGATAPFLSTGPSGLVVNINSGVAATHVVRTGPVNTDLTNPAVNVTIAPDSTQANQLTIGNSATKSTTGLFTFNDFGSFLTKVNATLDGSTHTLAKIVAVGSYDAATTTFTAYRVDLVVQP